MRDSGYKRFLSIPILVFPHFNCLWKSPGFCWDVGYLCDRQLTIKNILSLKFHGLRQLDDLQHDAVSVRRLVCLDGFLYERGHTSDPHLPPLELTGAHFDGQSGLWVVEVVVSFAQTLLDKLIPGLYVIDKPSQLGGWVGRLPGTVEVQVITVSIVAPTTSDLRGLVRKSWKWVNI